MGFGYKIHVRDVCLGDRIRITADDGERVTGKVVTLALLGDSHIRGRITMRLADGSVRQFDRDLGDSVTISWNREGEG